ncbi:MAG: Hdr-like menaquinol oxidoreductase, membrane bound triheme cytochrome c subunit DsrJ [Candidatus Desulfovibrio kirbyi]|jgi:hypothetical protein|uniref:Hdr-like menaquinol oxidoreductase, membrane bound triheme cytochrome c subunit DsrJ n=1 Tax=Candidatus Desulfovibrio kirbyi TaxID=2696086 RepID=A0A6L2R6P8_9BACT|nr:sulfate reduction electron transfer complex DsrMKJOP subunit DsrJ [Desulfovibrio sp.]GFH63203.1 MAG: Hdr-like menaquinol oxidoreductase, membrane bound triheme cytochrome c subunit DsrJ [Candidatus Desulfovibrio kirbyi]
MYNAKAVIFGILIFVGLCASPFWASFIGRDYKSTDIVLPKNEKNCIEDADFMRSQHMRLLNEWRDEALRNENRVYTALDGKKWVISLQNTCLKCHNSYEDFCQKCHVANSVYPYCWTCHIIPKGGK